MNQNRGEPKIYKQLLQVTNSKLRTIQNYNDLEETNLASQAGISTLGIDDEWAAIIGTDLGIGIDHYFDVLESGDDLDDAVADLAESTNVNTAQSYLDTISEDDITPREAIKVMLAVITSDGHRRLSKTSADLANQWLSQWQLVVQTQLSQEAEYTHWILQKLDDPQSPMPFKMIINDYCQRFYATTTLPMSSMAALPYADPHDDMYLEATKEIIESLAILHRLVKDIPINLDEPMNLGIYTAACRMSVSLNEARERLINEASMVEVYTEGLFTALQQWFYLTKEETQAILESHEQLSDESRQRLEELSASMIKSGEAYIDSLGIVIND